jgi:hypothetical protein
MQIVVEGKIKLFYSILFYSILFYSILLYYSILFYSILFYSILFYSILFHSILFYSASRVMCCCRPVAGHDYPGHGVLERGGQAGHPQGQAHPPHPPLQGNAYTSVDCQFQCWGYGTGSISQRYESGSFSFLIKVLSGLK